MRDWQRFVREHLALPEFKPEREKRIVRELAAQLEDFYRDARARGLNEAEALGFAQRQIRDWECFASDLRRADRPHTRPRIEQWSDRAEGIARNKGGWWLMFGDLQKDIQYAFRVLRKSPGFTAIAVLTLALGIGANTAMFSIVNTILLQPLPYQDAERMVIVRDVQEVITSAPASYPKYMDWKAQEQIFEDLAAYVTRGAILTGEGEPENLASVAVTPNLMPLLGFSPLLGRNFSAEEEFEGSERVVLISYALWQRRFGGEQEIVGKPIQLGGESHTVIGILPPEPWKRLPEALAWSRAPAIWRTLRVDPETANRGSHYLTVVGKLKEGVLFSQANAQIEEVGERLKEETGTTHGVTMVPLQEYLVGRSRTSLLVLMGAVGFVLLIACANVANLLLSRSAGRQKEIAVRMALGAGRLRVVRQLLTENLFLALGGGALGLATAWSSIHWFAQSGFNGIPRVEQLAINGPVLAFSFTAAVATGLLIGLLPAFQSTATDLNASLREGGRQPGAGSGGNKLRSLLVVSEIALSLVLLAGAGLLLRSFAGLLKINIGADTTNLLTARIDLPRAKYTDGEQIALFYRQLLERVSSQPGVEAATLANMLPLRGGTNGWFYIEGTEYAPGTAPLSERMVVGPDYFATMRIPILKGRRFTPQDNPDSLSVVVISEDVARRHFPGEDPIGKRISYSGGGNFENAYTVVGVAGNVRHWNISGENPLAIYHSHNQARIPALAVVLRTATDPLSLSGALRNAVRALDPDLPVTRLRTMEQIVWLEHAQRRLVLGLLGSFAALALLLASLGIYGVMSYSVSQRTHEMGIRMALGAGASDILGLVFRHAMTLTLLGVGLGLAGSAALSRFLAGQLVNVSPFDPLTFGVVAVLLTAVAAVACFVPARRATRVDPMVALRYE